MIVSILNSQGNSNPIVLLKIVGEDWRIGGGELEDWRIGGLEGWDEAGGWRLEAGGRAGQGRAGQGREPRRHDEHRVSFRYAIVFPQRTSCLRSWHGRVLDSDWSPGDRHSTRLTKLFDVSLRIRFRSMRMSWPCRLAAQWTVPSRGISG